LILLHIIVFLWGFTGIIGRELQFSVNVIVFLRMAIALISIGLYAWLFSKSLKLEKVKIVKLIVVGGITAAHWLCFFESIHRSNVSVALSVVSTTAFFVAVMSPIFNGKRWNAKELFLGLFVVIGVSLIFRSEGVYVWGIIFGLLAALFAATFSSFNGIFIREISATAIAFYEMLGGVFVLFFVLVWRGEVSLIADIRINDWLLLILLGTVTTAFAFIASVEVMKQLSPFSCAVAINLEPIYTILLALWLYGNSEYMQPMFYAGAGIILIAVFAEAVNRKRK
ncbi:MAG: DMT family transporter, partial [Bacteroidota bacterium]